MYLLSYIGSHYEASCWQRLVSLQLLSFNWPAKARVFNGLVSPVVTRGNGIMARNLLYMVKGLVCLLGQSEATSSIGHWE